LFYREEENDDWVDEEEDWEDDEWEDDDDWRNLGKSTFE